MKIVIVSIIAVLCFTSIISKFLKTEGLNSNYGAKSVEAVNSGYAKVKDVIVLTNDKKYRNPLIAMNLPLRKPIEGGQAEHIEEVPGPETYYDGQNGIKHTVSFCNQFITKPQACVNQGNCGWCMGSGSCVEGSRNGPLRNGDCLRGKYIFEAPSKDWNPLALPDSVTSRMNVMGAQLTTIVQQPSK